MGFVDKTMYMVVSMKALSKYWWGVLAYTYVILLWGTFVRASRSGSGCGTSWPKCEGSFLFDMNNIEQIVEYTHRLTSGLYGIVAMVLVWATLRRGRFERMAPLCFGFLFVVFLEAWIGRMLVVNEYVVDDQRLARLLWMGFHFLNTLLLVWVQVWVIEALSNVSRSIKDIVGSSLRWIGTHWVPLGFLVLSLLGIVTSFYDTTVVKGGQSSENFSAWIGWMRNVHPFAAVLYVLAIAHLANLQTTAPALRKKLYLVLVLNLVLGGMNVMFHHVTGLQVAHVFVTHMIWLVLVWMGVRPTTQET